MTKHQKIRIAKSAAINFAVVSAIAVLSFAAVDLLISPFAFAFLFAAIYTRANKVLIGTAAFLFSLFVMTGREDVVSGLYSTIVFFIAAYSLPRIQKKYRHKSAYAKYKIEVVILFVFYILSHAASIFFALNDTEYLYISLVNLCVGAVFLSVCVGVIVALRTRLNRIPWTIDQKMCAGVFLIVLSLGLCGIPYGYFNVFKFASVLVILFAVTTLDARAALIIAVCLGLGGALLSFELTSVACFALLALAGVAFKSKLKIPSVIAVLLTDMVLGYYFRAYDGYGIYDFLPTVIACILILTVPKGAIKHFDFSGKFLGGYLVSKNTINKNRQGIYKRLDNLSDVFNEMQNIYKNLVTGAAAPADTARIVSRDLAAGVCQNCENRPNCRRDGASMTAIDNALEQLCYIGASRGNVNIMDAGADLTMRCKKLNAILNKTNNLIAAVHKRQTANQHLDAGKILMAGLLSGMSRLCKNFATDLCSGVVFDIERAVAIKDALLRAGIVASDCLLTKNGRGEYSVSVLVPRDAANNPMIERVISDVSGHKMTVDCIDDAETSGFAIITVKTAPRYSVAYGVAQVSKNFNPTCGDTFTVLKITHNQSMMAICDGMGAGEGAYRASVLALGLVENFYKAGFPNEVIMESVNQLLIITEQEVFSAIDIAVFSLGDGMVNFIKVGGVEGFIKRQYEVEVIEAGSLPLGIVDEMTPKITRAHLISGDMVVLVSDGVTDSFGDRVALGNFINNIDGTLRRDDITNAQKPTPQYIADEIIAEVLRRTDKIAIDDCTVLVAQIV